MWGTLLEGTCAEEVIAKFLGNTHYTNSQKFYSSWKF